MAAAGIPVKAGAAAERNLRLGRNPRSSGRRSLGFDPAGPGTAAAAPAGNTVAGPGQDIAVAALEQDTAAVALEQDTAAVALERDTAAVALERDTAAVALEQDTAAVADTAARFERGSWGTELPGEPGRSKPGQVQELARPEQLRRYH
jgi:hypothetical protein